MASPLTELSGLARVEHLPPQSDSGVLWSDYARQRHVARSLHLFSPTKWSMPWAVRELLLVAVLGFAASGAGGCFVPTPLQEEGNSGQPYVNLKATTPDVNDPVPVWRGESLFLNLGLADPDSYTLYYRVFLDARYDEVIHEGAVPGCTPTCGAHFEIVGLCDEMVNNVLGIHVLEAYVSDKAFEDNDKKDLRRTAAGGLRDSVLWRIDCQQAVGTVDGGA